jgi:hypothetical protein
MSERSMNRGDTLVFDLQVFQPIAGTSQQVPANITGWFVWFTVKRYVQDADNMAVAAVTTTPTSVPPGGSITIVDAFSGKLEVTMPAAATLLLPDGGTTKLVYDVQVKDLLGRIFTVDAGTIAVTPDVTRATS